MKFADHLSKESIREFNQMRRAVKPVSEQKRPAVKEKRKRVETYTEKEWLEIMGANRDTYKRVNGALRRK